MTRTARVLTQWLLVAGCAIGALSSCDGVSTSSVDQSSNEPPPPLPPPRYPAPVGSVRVTGVPVSVAQVGDSIRLSAEVRRFDGGLLTGRTVTWSAAGDATASIDAHGLMRVFSPGNILVTATSEDQSGQVTIPAGYGAQLDYFGGTVEYLSHATLRVPYAALFQQLRIAVAPGVVPVTFNNFTQRTVIPGTFIVCYPRDLNFESLAEGTVTLTYDPRALPAGYDPRNLVILQYSANSVSQLAATSVDTVAHTVASAHIKGLYSFGVGY